MIGGRFTALLSAAGLVTASAVATLALGSPPAAAAPTVLASAPGSSVHFATAGDFGSTADASGVLAGMGAATPDFDLALGDLSYGADGDEPAWCSFVRSEVGPGTPFELITGNHESNGLNGNINNFAACLPNGLTGLVGTYGKEWYVDVPASDPIMRIIMISPNLAFPGGTWQYTAGSPHYNWTANAIDGAHAANIPWVVVGMHEPCLAMTAANCSSGPDLMNLLVAKKVDLVLSGHVHMYARTKQLAYSPSCPVIRPNTSSAACIADSDNSMNQGGTVFATVGTGGEDEQTPNPSDPEAPYFASYSASKAWGFLDVTADSGQLRASFDRTSGGALSDSFTISRDVGGSTATAAFISSCSQLACGFDGSGSSDSGGSILTYAWAFGDGAKSTGATPSHTYAASGSYQVSLTVTDDSGATDTVVEQVQVASDGGGGGGGPGVSFVGAKSVAGGAVRSEQVPVPSGAQAGDVLVAIFSGTGTWSGPTGVSGLESLGSYTTNANTSSAWVTVLGAADLGTSVRMDTAAYSKGVLEVMVYSGVDGAQVTAAHVSDTQRAAHSSPSMNAIAGSWVVSYWTDKSAATSSWTAPTGVAVRNTIAGTGAGRYSSLLADSGSPVPAGTYGPLTATANSTASSAHSWAIDLPPAESGDGGSGSEGIAFVDAAEAAGGAVKTIQTPIPPTTEAGDTVVLLFTGNAGWSGPTGVGGWIALGSFTNGSVTSSVWTKEATAADPGAIVRMTNAAYNKGVLTVAVYSGVDASSVGVAHAGDTSRSVHSSPAVTVSGDAWVMSYWADKSASTTAWTAPSEVVNRGVTAGTGGGHFSVLLTDSGAPVLAGGYGPLTATANSAGSSAETWAVTLPSS